MSHRLLKFLLPYLFVLVLSTAATACPMCKEALEQNDPVRQGVVKGYFFSILFMMATPYLTLVGIITYFALLVRKARRNARPAVESLPLPVAAESPSAAVCGR